MQSLSFLKLNRLWVQWLAVMLFISLGLLLQENMGLNNEIDVLPLARQFAQPDWIPGDWYLNRPVGYRFVFSGIVGWLAAHGGFLATSIVGCLVCYGLVSFGLVAIGRQLHLSLPFLLLAIALFLYNSSDQGAAAEEWIVGSLEAKAVAYGFVLWAIASLLRGQYSRVALLLGLATSFHVLVGGWAMLTAVIWGVGRRGWVRPLGASLKLQVGSLLLCLSLYSVGAALAIPAILKQLLSAHNPADVSPSFIYVFLRLSHHLNPYAWPIWCWTRLAAFAALFAVLVGLLRRYRSLFPGEQYGACWDWIAWVLCSLVPYGLGLVLAPFDPEGRWLQYYPFRLGDVMLPLGTCFLLACLLEQSLRHYHSHLWRRVGMGLLGMFVVGQTVLFGLQLGAIAPFPSEPQTVNPAWAEFCAWVRQNTPQNAQFIIPPLGRDSFTWLAERPIVAGYKFLPQTPNEIVEWYHRVDDLTAGTFTRLNENGDWLRATPNVGREIRRQLREGFATLNTEEAIALLEKYDASYFLTHSWHRLDLTIAHEVFPYVLYHAP